MFRSLWDRLFGTRAKWVLEYIDEEDGQRSRARFWLYNPTEEDIERLEAEQIRPLVESGWRVVIRPRRNRRAYP